MVIPGINLRRSCTCRWSATHRGAGAVGHGSTGLLADVVVPSQGIFVVPAEALPATRSVLTIIGGAIAYEGAR